MKDKTLSRGPHLNMEKCAENVGGSRFNLVLIAAIRAREIKKKGEYGDLGTSARSPLTAMQEIQDGKIGLQYLVDNIAPRVRKDREKH